MQPGLDMAYSSRAQDTRLAWQVPLSALWPIWALTNGVWDKTGGGVPGSMRLTLSEMAQAWSTCAGVSSYWLL